MNEQYRSQPHEPRTYRQRCRLPDMTAYQVVVKETDLWIQSPVDLRKEARELVLQQRGYLENWIVQYPAFRDALTPWPLEMPAPAIVAEMAAAGQAAGTGPMAAVAGALAEAVARGLHRHSEMVLVENGGDVFIQYPYPLTIAVAAGASPLSMRLGIRIDDCRQGRAVCTSSGTVGHSLSMGSADAICVISDSGALADAVATAIGNRVRCEADIGPAVEFGSAVPGVDGILVIRGSVSGAWGDLTLVPLH
ncbi:MAG: UPF0280 family protein [Desulfosarcinaceae bacterium]|nr:UPF0280 family protein [Desulfosarcinaceae bacterium]